MAKRYLLGEKAVRQLEDLMPYLDRLKRTTKTTIRPKPGGRGDKSFLAKITNIGPNDEADFTDARYWVREIICTNSDGDYTSNLTFAYPAKPSVISVAQWSLITRWVAATNLDELVQVIPLHDMPIDDSVLVLVHVVSDQDKLPRYIFSGPAIVVD